jgi:trans-2,3-dihydro-3-hydroxyanthranilate isomerase
LSQAKQGLVEFYFVDVFSTQPLEGNPLAVVPNADDLDVSTMQRIAREFNQSETTFLLRPTQPATWRLRSFTAAGIEVFGAGHNALGAWWWMAESAVLGTADGRRKFTQQIGENVLPVEITFQDGRPISVAMQHGVPKLGEICSDLKPIAAALGGSPDEIRHELPTQVVSTGAAHLMVPMRSRAAIDSLQPDSSRLLLELKRMGAQGCYAFSLDPFHGESTAYARFFNPTAGIWEDPATGSAAGPLGYYLRIHNVLRTDGECAIEQGYKMGRPSQIVVSVRKSEVSIRGAAFVAAQGTLKLTER